MACWREFRKGRGEVLPWYPKPIGPPPLDCGRGGPEDEDAGSARRQAESLFLQLPFQGLDLLGERVVVADEVLDLAHRMQDGGVIAAAEPPAYLGQ